MSRVLAYHRPTTIEECLPLLGGSAVPLAGGVDLVGRLNLGEVRDLELVDLQDLGLDTITVDADGAVARLGAMASFAALAGCAALPDTLRAIARAEEPSTLRTRSTVGGLVAGRAWDSWLLAALLAADASVGVRSRAGERTLTISDALAAGLRPGDLVTHVDLPLSGTWASASTARTPADKPIVGAVGRRRSDDSTVVAMCGVATTPVVVDPDRLPPEQDFPSDFRGSSAYRRHLADVNGARVLAALNGEKGSIR